MNEILGCLFTTVGFTSAFERKMIAPIAFFLSSQSMLTTVFLILFSTQLNPLAVLSVAQATNLSSLKTPIESRFNGF